MSQHDYIISNDTGANVRSDLNNALGAIATINSGATEPSTTYAYQLWMDTSSNVLKIRNSANSAWYTLPISPVANNTVDINGGTIDGASVAATSLSSTGTTALQNLSTTNSALNISSSASDGSATIDASGNLLVGKTSTNIGTQGFEHKSTGQTFCTRTGTSDPADGFPLYINRLTYDGGLISFRKDGTTVGSIGVDSGSVALDGPSANVGIRMGGVAVLPRKSSADSDAQTSLGTSAARFKDLYLSGGVYLGGTGSANYLDDYEFGEWTPAFEGDSSNPTCTYDNVVYGTYTKIGRLVVLQGCIRTDSVSGGSGNLLIGDLPFTASTGFGGGTVRYAGNVGSRTTWNANKYPTELQLQVSSDFMYILTTGSSAWGSTDASNVQVSDLKNASNANSLEFSISYITA